MTRGAVDQTSEFAKANSMGFRFTGIPSDVQFGGSLAFEKGNMAATFDYGVRCASRGQVWVTKEQSIERTRAEDAALQPFATADCPLAPKQ